MRVGAQTARRFIRNERNMGTRHILLIACAVVVVDILVSTGCAMFRDRSSSPDCDSMTSDFIAMSQVGGYYHRPVFLSCRGTES